MWVQVLFGLICVCVSVSVASDVKPALLITDTFGGLSMLQAGTWNVTQIISEPNILYGRTNYYYADQYVYWEEYFGKVYRLKLQEGYEKELVISTSHLQNFAIDWVNWKIYWLTMACCTTYYLKVAQIDGSIPRMLTSWDAGTKFDTEIILDPFGRYVYIVTGNGIERIGMDGKGRTVVWRMKSQDFTIDFQNQRLYFMGKRGLESVYLNGTDHKKRLTPYYRIRPMNFFKGNIFMGIQRFKGSKNDDYILRYNTHNGGLTDMGGPSLIGDFKIYDASMQPPSQSDDVLYCKVKRMPSKDNLVMSV